MRVIAHVVDPNGALSERQMQRIVEYGRDRQTLVSESAGVGKPMAHQMWKVLEALGCLMYG